MSNRNIKAFLCSISEYEHMNQLPYCKNESNFIKNKLIERLKVVEENIIIPTLTGRISSSEYTKSYKKFIASLEDNDIVFIYHSGHGDIDPEYNDLILYTSDSTNLYTGVPSINLTRLLNEQNVSNIIYLFDCCFSGAGVENINVSEILSENIFKKFGNGSAIMTSCNKNETSGFYNETVSVFTKFLLESFDSRFSYKNNYFCLNEFKNNIMIYSNVWSRKNPDSPQTPLFISNMLGTIMLPIELNPPPKINKNSCFYQGEDFEIYDIEYQKKYRENETIKTLKATILINQTNNENFYLLLKNIVERIRKTNIDINVIFLYIGNDEIDRDEHYYEYRAIWANKQAEYWVGSLGRNSLNCDKYGYVLNNSYKQSKQFRLSNILFDNDLYIFWKNIFIALMPIIKNAISCYEKYSNGDISYVNLCSEHSKSAKIANSHCRSAEDSPFPHPKSALKDFDKACVALIGDFSELFIYYGIENNKDEQNRKDCFEQFLSRYYQDCEKVKINIPDL